MPYLDDIVPAGTERYRKQDLVLAEQFPQLISPLRLMCEYSYRSFSGQNPIAKQTIPPVLDAILDMAPDELSHTLSSGYGQTAIEIAATAFEIEILKTRERKIAWMVPPWAWYVSVGNLAHQSRIKVIRKTDKVAKSANEAMARIGLKGIEHSMPYEKYLQAVQQIREKGAQEIEHFVSYGIGDFLRKDAMLIQAIFEVFNTETLNVYAIDCNSADAIFAEERLKKKLDLKYHDRIRFHVVPHTFAFLKESNWFDMINGGKLNPDKTIMFHSGNSGLNLNFSPFEYYTSMEKGWLIQELHNVANEGEILTAKNPLSHVPGYIMQASRDYCSTQTFRVATPLMRFLFPQAGKNPIVDHHLDITDPEKALVAYCPNDERGFPQMLAIAPSLDLDLVHPLTGLGPCVINSELYRDVLERSVIISILTGKTSRDTIQDYMLRVGIHNISVVDSDHTHLGGIEYPSGAVKLYVADARLNEPTYRSYPFIPSLSAVNF